ncbi:MAG TPA: acyl-ACP--UDP-N-acetylglucosamine O-acyltransferase, partial [Prevotella sp.]
TRMGNNNKIHQNAVLAALPQDFNFRGEKSQLVIGDNNIIRENVVINRATHRGGQTVLGNGNVLMEGVHISHDTKMGNNCVVGYGTKIAGDCIIEDGVIFSSSVIENAKTRVGEAAMIQAGTTFSKDVPPYIIAGGNPVVYGGPNVTMMTAYGIDEKVQKHIANAYRLVFHGQNSVFDSVLQINDQVPDSPEIRKIVNFINDTQLGIISKM